MTSRAQMLEMMEVELNNWESLLGDLTDDQIHIPLTKEGWAVKDIVAHLWAWQLRTLARLEAAVNHTEPDMPQWPDEFEIEIPEEPDELNNWLFETYKDKPWEQVYADWKTNFQRIITLGGQVPETDLLEKGHYPWLAEYPLGLVLTSTVDHHEEHRGWLMPLLED